MRPLYRTTIVIWSEFDPSDMELSWLAREAEEGEALCTKNDITYVEKPEDDPDFEEGVESFFWAVEEEREVNRLEDEILFDDDEEDEDD